MKVDLRNLEPNPDDPLCGWLDKITGENFRVMYPDGDFVVMSHFDDDEEYKIIHWPKKKQRHFKRYMRVFARPKNLKGKKLSCVS